MRGRPVLISVLALGLVLALAAGLGLAQEPEPQGNTGTEAVPVGTSFTYQGRLTDAGGPVDRSCDFTFRLYDAAGSGSPPSGGTLLGTASKSSQTVSEGLFTVQLDFGSAVFEGDGRWLQIEVDCGGGAATLSPRQELTAAPHALYALKAPWSGLMGVPAELADGDDDTTYDAGTGLDLSGGVFGLDASYRLPQACGNGQIAEWSGSA